jgi:hypothetical protein
MKKHLYSPPLPEHQPPALLEVWPLLQAMLHSIPHH